MLPLLLVQQLSTQLVTNLQWGHWKEGVQALQVQMQGEQQLIQQQGLLPLLPRALITLQMQTGMQRLPGLLLGQILVRQGQVLLDTVPRPTGFMCLQAPCRTPACYSLTVLHPAATAREVPLRLCWSRCPSHPFCR